MGFCRRCGEIVVGPKCKCGGRPVDPVVRWNPGNNTNTQVSDRWSQTYVARDKSPDRRPPSRGPPSNISTPEPQPERSVSPTKRFPRPNTGASTHALQPLTPRVTAHITSTTTYGPPSPLKYSSSISDASSSPTSRAESGILPSPDKSELIKAYGSILQPKETLSTYSCTMCSSTFPPDATIYPDPNAPSTSNRFLCRPCFTTNGGSKGDCPTCDRPVLILKSEGGFVENSGRVWHKRCFCCESCFKNIGDTPMVDLMGRPSCAECFDSCLKKSPGRDSAKHSPRRLYDSPDNTKEKSSNPGGLIGSRKSREGSPAIEELEQRLGIVKSRESSPALEELSQRLSAVSARTPTKDSPRRSLIAQWSGSRESSPLVERRGRGRNVAKTDGGGSPLASADADKPTHQVTFEKQQGEEVADSPSQRLFERITSPEGKTTPKTSQSPISTDDAVEEMKKRFLKHSASSSSLASNPSSVSPSPLLRRPTSTSRTPTPQKLLSKIPVSTSRHGSPSLRSSFSTSGLPSTRDRDSYASSISSSSDLTADFSDTITESSAPSSPPSFSPPSSKDDVFGSSPRCYPLEETTDDEGQDTFNIRTTPTPKSKAPSLPHNLGTQSPVHLSSKSCDKCEGALFTTKDGGKFVTVPGESGEMGTPPKTYHSECFRCNVCRGTFKETGAGQAVFVRGENGACHPECAPPEKIKIQHIPRARATSIPSSKTSTMTAPAPTRTSMTLVNHTSMSSQSKVPLPKTALATTTSLPRFGSSVACPGCHKSVSVMEKGVVPGPQGTKWHSTCLVCGGKDATNRRGRREDDKQPGCGKRLDSAAKADGEGGVWCRECLSLLPSALRSSPESSPTLNTAPVAPSYTGMRNGGPFGSGNIPSRTIIQHRGTTTLARQFTGVGGSDAALMRQLTGGGLTPTRQLTGSPTKQLGMLGSSRPRPKSVIGISTRSVDEGRGMYLVRELTGVGE